MHSLMFMLLSLTTVVSVYDFCEGTQKLYQSAACCDGNGEARCVAPSVELKKDDLARLEKLVDSNFVSLAAKNADYYYDAHANAPPVCDSEKKKNVILMIGDGFGWESNRAGAVAKRVLAELSSFGIPPTGTTNATLAAQAKQHFEGRTLADYYESGKGSGLESQGLETFTLVEASTLLLRGSVPETITDRGNYSFYADATSLRGPVSEVNGKDGSPLTGQRPYMAGANHLSLKFDGRDIGDGGMVVGWNLEKGGYPWQSSDIITGRKTKEEAGVPNFDPMYRHNHATDSANTATAYATGHKVANNMMSVDINENVVPTLLEEAMSCGMAGGVVSSVPVIHATPGAFITHSAYRKSNDMNKVTEQIDPTLIMGGCVSRYQPTQSHKDRLAAKGAFFSQSVDIPADMLLVNMTDKDPDTDKIIACTVNNVNMPYRGLDSGYSGRHGADDDPETTGMTDYYDMSVVASVPKMKDQCTKAIEFMAKADHGFFLMMEQGDIDWALHANNMDDMLGAVLDFDDCIKVFKDWIDANGGYEKNAIYVTADHDHFLNLEAHFPEVLAKLIIDGKSHHITPATHVATGGGLHADDNVETHQWSDSTVDAVGHFHALRGQHNWNGHTNMPIPMYASGDDGCLQQQQGRGYKIAGQVVKPLSGLPDQVHVHECIRKQLFGY